MLRWDKCDDIIDQYLQRVLPFFPTAFINGMYELILEPKNNIYFSVDDCPTDLDFNCRMIEWLSRPASKHVTPYWQRYFLRGVNSYFGINWSIEDMSAIYSKIGNGINRQLTRKLMLDQITANDLRKML
jgi:hypothetical protein